MTAQVNKATPKFCNLKMVFESETLTYIKDDSSTRSKLHCASQLLSNVTGSRAKLNPNLQPKYILCPSESKLHDNS